MTTLDTPVQRTDNKKFVLSIVITVVVVTVLAIVGHSLFKSELPSYAAQPYELGSISAENRLYVDSMVDYVDFTAPLTYVEKERLVLGAAMKVCQEANESAYMMNPSIEYLAGRAWLFGVFNDPPRQASFVAQSLDRFC